MSQQFFQKSLHLPDHHSINNFCETWSCTLWGKSTQQFLFPEVHYCTNPIVVSSNKLSLQSVFYFIDHCHLVLLMLADLGHNCIYEFLLLSDLILSTLIQCSNELSTFTGVILYYFCMDSLVLIKIFQWNCPVLGEHHDPPKHTCFDDLLVVMSQKFHCPFEESSLLLMLSERVEYSLIEFDFLSLWTFLFVFHGGSTSWRTYPCWREVNEVDWLWDRRGTVAMLLGDKGWRKLSLLILINAINCLQY